MNHLCSHKIVHPGFQSPRRIQKDNHSVMLRNLEHRHLNKIDDCFVHKLTFEVEKKLFVKRIKILDIMKLIMLNLMSAKYLSNLVQFSSFQEQ